MNGQPPIGYKNREDRSEERFSFASTSQNPEAVIPPSSRERMNKMMHGDWKCNLCREPRLTGLSRYELRLGITSNFPGYAED